MAAVPMLIGLIATPTGSSGAKEIKVADSGAARMVRPLRPAPSRADYRDRRRCPQGQSLAARMMILLVRQGDVKFETVLTQCQKDAREGLYAMAMGGFIQWVAKRFPQTAYVSR